uniref:1,3-beta-glucanosyltransferase n=1 Tax=Talaromyces marneffei PM1 TaxID=1077442 RepID=A0A093XQP2_TALMA
MTTQRDYSDVDVSGLDPGSNLVSACEQQSLSFTVAIDFSVRKGNSTWQTSVFNQYAAVLNSMALYDNLLGLNVGNEIVDQSRQYRTIPMGYFTNDDNWAQPMADYLVCGGDKSEAIDFLGVNNTILGVANH